MSFDAISRKAARINFALDVRSVTTYLNASGGRKWPCNELGFIENGIFSGSKNDTWFSPISGARLTLDRSEGLALSDLMIALHPKQLQSLQTCCSGGWNEGEKRTGFTSSYLTELCSEKRRFDQSCCEHKVGESKKWITISLGSTR